ncbi:transcriptional regulator [Vagococcus entomophilus]|uniref:Transcriptional regulator n=1 Tax=Vagococcus entomophilus TaxID=1160095 RepID=A0A430AL34_9ENTE|nr:helix-turn-helix transcriptional regulator [Vagococcus entomophilus]RSU08808.1 transcriptional regulator [Vagococcus entomophilus]
MSLRAARINAGFTLKEASREVGIHHETLAKYEKDSGNIPINLLNELSILYQIQLDYIFLGKRYDLIRTIRNKSKIAT